ncbi:hypothetical protein ACK03K_17345 [[Kitasatospora] papulosa]|uniref:hypothetical protein n=1 Tax=[Kitasatospora] papulosa TaxID=1464011 RepID=UPI0039081910
MPTCRPSRGRPHHVHRPDDVSGAYGSHANAYVTKPVNLEAFEQAVQSIDTFYLDTATRPRP